MHAMQRDDSSEIDFPNARVVSSRWVDWRRRIDIDDYDARFERMEATGQDVHGEADLIAHFSAELDAHLSATPILDAGCGTGRIAIELARRGCDVVGVDLDADMIAAARRKAPDATWIVDDLARMRLQRNFGVIAMPGNVMIFCEPGDRRAIVENLADHLLPGGLLIVGFSLEHGGYTLDEWDEHCMGNGFILLHRFGTWSRADFERGGAYHVSVHQLNRSPVQQ